MSVNAMTNAALARRPDFVPAGRVPQGLTEFNMLFGTQGRLIFDYHAGDFYLSGHYQGCGQGKPERGHGPILASVSAGGAGRRRRGES